MHFISAVCENMVSAEAMRPGDVLVASNGKTIEVYYLFFAFLYIAFLC